jgi:hypothetical protein
LGRGGGEILMYQLYTYVNRCFDWCLYPGNRTLLDSVTNTKLNIFARVNTYKALNKSFLSIAVDVCETKLFLLLKLQIL